jgi:hypothetical protein
VEEEMTAANGNGPVRARLRSCPFQHAEQDSKTQPICNQRKNQNLTTETRRHGEDQGQNPTTHSLRSRKNDILKFMLAGIALCFSIPLTFGQTESKPADSKLAQEKKAEQKTENPQKLFSSQCGVDFEGAPLHVFVNSASKGWKEYRDIKNLPELSSAEDSEFIVRSDPSGKHYVRTFIPGDDFDRYQDDCFGESGRLQSFHYELRTAWGWGYEESRTFNASGKMVDKSSRFFDTRNEKTIQTPERAKEVPDAIKPEVHTEFDDMPFISYLNE